VPCPVCGFLSAELASEALRLGCRARRSRQGFGVALCIGRSIETLSACKAIAVNWSHTCARTSHEPASSQAFSVEPVDGRP
jgi:hypothetical protein